MMRFIIEPADESYIAMCKCACNGSGNGNCNCDGNDTTYGTSNTATTK